MVAARRARTPGSGPDTTTAGAVRAKVDGYAPGVWMAGIVAAQRVSSWATTSGSAHEAADDPPGARSTIDEVGVTFGGDVHGVDEIHDPDASTQGRSEALGVRKRSEVVKISAEDEHRDRRRQRRAVRGQHRRVVVGPGPVKADVIRLGVAAHRNPFTRAEGRERTGRRGPQAGFELAAPRRRGGLEREQLGVVRAADRHVRAVGEVAGIGAAAVAGGLDDEGKQRGRVALQGSPHRGVEVAQNEGIGSRILNQIGQPPRIHHGPRAPGADARHGSA